MTNKEKALKTLEEIAQLEQNWNSYDAPPITPKAIEIARTILEITEHHYIFPNAFGGINFEWDNGDKALEIWIMADGSLEYLTMWGTKYEDEGETTLVDFMKLVSWVNS